MNVMDELAERQVAIVFGYESGYAAGYAAAMDELAEAVAHSRAVVATGGTPEFVPGRWVPAPAETWADRLAVGAAARPPRRDQGVAA